MKKKYLKDISSDSNISELVSKAGIYLLFKVLGFLLAYVFAYLIIRQFGAEKYGFVTLSFTFIVIGSAITRLGLDVNLTRYFSSNISLDDKKGIYLKSITTSIILSFIVTFFIFLFSEQIAINLFSNRELESYLTIGAITIPAWAVVMINTGVFRGLKKNTLYSFFNTFGRFLFTLIFAVVFILYLKMAPIWSIISHFLGVYLLSLISFIFIFKSLGKPSFKSSISLTSFVSDSTPILIAGLIITLLDWSDKIFIGIFRDELLVGVYDIVFRIAILIKFSLEAINSILAPKISELYNNNLKIELQSLISFSVKLNSFISFLLFICLVLFSEFILGFLGEEFVTQEAKLSLIVLAFGQLIVSICGSVGVILPMTGNQKKYRNLAFIAIILNLFLNFILIKAFGIIGASIATAISYIFLNISSTIYIKSKMNIDAYLKIF